MNEAQATVEYTIKDVTLDKKEMKFRYLHNWGVDIPYQGATVKMHSNMGAVTKGAISEAFSECKGGGDNFTVGKAGIYDVTLKLDLRTGVFFCSGYLYGRKTLQSATLPEKMFVVGAPWDWKWEKCTGNDTGT